jgi:hypothetical protein
LVLVQTETEKPLSITATASPSDLANRKFCSTTRMVVSGVFFSSRNASIMLPMIAGARPLVGSSIRNSLRGSMMARAIESICFCPPESTPAASDQNLSSAGNRPKIQRSRVSSIGPERAAKRRFSRTVRSAKMPMFSGT